jgi:hypothetical protein
VGWRNGRVGACEVSQAPLRRLDGLRRHGRIFVAAAQEQSLRDGGQQLGRGLGGLVERRFGREAERL